MISRDTNGKVTKIVASTTPGNANVMRMFVPKNWLIARIAGYVQPSRPKVIKKARPTMTGEIENGISISVASTCFPRKENFVKSHAATIPKNVLTTIAITVASNVTKRAERTYSVVTACR